MNIFNLVLSLVNFLAEEDSNVTYPLYKFISGVGPYAIGVSLALSIFVVIIYGVQYAKAEGTDERKAAQKKLISFVIGAVVILLLIIILYAIREPLAQWANS